MAKKKKKGFKKLTSYHYGKFIKNNLKWILGLFAFVSFIVFITSPTQALIDSFQWLLQFPPIYWFDMLLPALLFCVATGIILRGAYKIYKGQKYID